MTICGLCGHQIRKGERLSKRKGNWVHRSCMPGQDDE